jgi:hypothetical protein
MLTSPLHYEAANISSALWPSLTSGFHVLKAFFLYLCMPLPPKRYSPGSLAVPDYV